MKKRFYKMDRNDATGVFVTTKWEGCAYYTTIHNGDLDGDQFACMGDPHEQHNSACWLAGVEPKSQIPVVSNPPGVDAFMSTV